jgi:hypothetical protein
MKLVFTNEVYSACKLVNMGSVNKITGLRSSIVSSLCIVGTLISIIA